jgi:hypothetical protein
MKNILKMQSCRYVWIVSYMVYFFDDMDSLCEDRMIRLIEMLVNNSINIINDVWSMTSYLFV